MKNLFLLIILFIAVACTKQSVPFYNGANGITFYKGAYDPDSLSYSFAYSLVEKQKDTVWLNMRIVGATADHERVVAVKAGVGTTAREGKDYLLPEAKLPAGALFMRYPVVLLNSTEMKTTAFRLVAEVTGSKDFVLGAVGTEVGGSISLSKMIVNFSGQFLRPSYWSASGYGNFGLFSIAKFRFMMEQTGLTNFSVEAIGQDQYYNLPIILQRKLNEYETMHGPLIDENGNRVVFNA